MRQLSWVEREEESHNLLGQGMTRVRVCFFWGGKGRRGALPNQTSPNTGVEVPMPCNGVLRLRKRHAMSGAIMLMPPGSLFN